jgi:hypothetical protein
MRKCAGVRAQARGTAAPIAWMIGGAHFGPVILDQRTGKPTGCRRARHDLEHDARALTVTAPYVKSPQPTDGMDRGTHTQLATIRRY